MRAVGLKTNRNRRRFVQGRSCGLYKGLQVTNNLFALISLPVRFLIVLGSETLTPFFFQVRLLWDFPTFFPIGPGLSDFFFSFEPLWPLWDFTIFFPYRSGSVRFLVVWGPSSLWDFTTFSLSSLVLCNFLVLWPSALVDILPPSCSQVLAYPISIMFMALVLGELVTAATKCTRWRTTTAAKCARWNSTCWVNNNHI